MGFGEGERRAGDLAFHAPVTTGPPAPDGLAGPGDILAVLAQPPDHLQALVGSSPRPPHVLGRRSRHTGLRTGIGSREIPACVGATRALHQDRHQGHGGVDTPHLDATHCDLLPPVVDASVAPIARCTWKIGSRSTGVSGVVQGLYQVPLSPGSGPRLNSLRGPKRARRVTVSRVVWFGFVSTISSWTPTHASSCVTARPCTSRPRPISCWRPSWRTVRRRSRSPPSRTSCGRTPSWSKPTWRTSWARFEGGWGTSRPTPGSH